MLFRSGWFPVDRHCEKCDTTAVFKVAESDCLICNQYKQIRVYDSQSGECKLKESEVLPPTF